MTCRYRLSFILLFVVWVQSLSSRHLFHTPDPELSSLREGFIRLTEEDALEGVLKDNTMVFGLSVVRKNTTFPDVLLSLEVFNPAANADISCLPFNSSIPTLEDHWSSDNAQGIDYVFISTNSPYYAQAITDNVNGIAEFECTLKHVSSEDPLYLIQMDVSYTKREMRDVEQEAMKEIYDACCQSEGSCGGWNEQLHSVELEETKGTRKVTDFDFCHVTSNVCDEDGYMLKLTMDRFGLECDFPTEQISKFERLRKISMTGNILGGKIMDVAEAFQDMKYLDEVSLSYNRLTGHLGKETENDDARNPLCVLARQGLKHLHLENNNIHGSVPECLLSSGSELRDLILDTNPISGTIPNKIPVNSSLEVISIRGGNLTGEFPETFIYAENLVLMDLSSNRMEGELPDEFGPSPKLKNLMLSGNKFTGKIPDGIAASETLESVTLDHNAFTAMPDQWLRSGPVTPLVKLDISFNEIEEDFPAALALHQHLSRLYLNDNKFRGPLPTLNDMFPNAWVLNFSNNLFDGSLPIEWTTLGIFRGTASELTYVSPTLDLSFNVLGGKLPEFFFDIDNFPKDLLAAATVNFEGNSFFCPETGTAVHLNGFEHCTESKKPAFGESEFDISVDGGQSHAFGAATIDENHLPGVDEEDQEIFTKSSDNSSSSSDDNNTWIIVICIISAAVFVSVIIASALRFKMYRLAKTAMGAPPSDVEIAAVRHEPLETSTQLEEARLRTASEQNSESNPL